MREIDKIIIHCAYTPPSMDIGAAEIRQWHLARGWSDIGYHYVIRRNGEIEAGRALQTIGAHAKGYNRHSIGVCLVGGKPDCNFTADQWESLHSLANELTAMHPGADLIGHNEVSPKSCPQFDVRAWAAAQ